MKKDLKFYLEENNVEIALISTPENFFYVSGIASHQHSVTRLPNLACAVITSTSTKLIVMDFEMQRILNNTDLEVFAYDTWVGAKTFEDLKDDLKSKDLQTFFDVLKKVIPKGIKTIGIEKEYLSLNFFQKLKELFDVEFIDISSLLLKARKTKDEEEIEQFRRLIKIQDNALNIAFKNIGAGRTEKDIEKIYRSEIFKENIIPSAWSMFSTGINSSYIGLANETKIEENDLFKYDGGVNAEFNYYTTDFARTWFVKNIDSNIFTLKLRLFEAQRLMIDFIKPGVSFSDLFKVGFNYVKEKYPNYERGHLGHSISLGPSTWEAPFISINEKTLIEENMILCVEVPMYLKGLGGFNIEDMVLVTKNGCEILSNVTPHFSQYELLLKN